MDALSVATLGIDTGTNNLRSRLRRLHPGDPGPSQAKPARDGSKGLSGLIVAQEASQYVVAVFMGNRELRRLSSVQHNSPLLY